MKKPNAASALTLSLALSACGGAPDGHGGVDEATGTTQQGLRALGSTFATSTPSSATATGPSRIVVGTVVAPPAAVIQQIWDSDLRPDGAMRVVPGDPSSLDQLMIDVMNVGNIGASGPSGTVSVNGQEFPAALWSYDSTAAANTLAPGQRGYLVTNVPYGFVQQDCQAVSVSIDVGRTMQTSNATAVDVFANDTRTVLPYRFYIQSDGTAVPSVCGLGWSTPINEATLGWVADVHEDGKSLQDIVSSVEIARVDGFRCSHCHANTGGLPDGPLPYQPSVAQDAVSSPLIDAFQPSGGNVEGPVNWACGGNPWSRQFMGQPTADPTVPPSMQSPNAKPQYLKDAFQKWVNDGTQP